MNNPIKITSKGKVSLPVSKSLKPFFLNLLMAFMARLDEAIATKRQLTILNNEERVYRAIVDEIFCKYHTQLTIINHDARLLLTLAQAHVLWELCQQWDDITFTDPEMGGLLVHLHQKLL